MLFFTGTVAFAVIGVFLFYKFILSGKFANGMVVLFQRIFKLDYVDALHLYRQSIRNWADVYITLAVGLLFLLLVRMILGWFTRYLKMINQEINSILKEEEKIQLPSELASTERNLRRKN